MPAESEAAGRPAAERLNRFLARSGVCSRRDADRLIATGRVLVNGVRPPATGQVVDPALDEVTVNGERVRHIDPLYLLVNKPIGHVTTASDPGGRPTVMRLLPPEYERASGIFPVGRLDVDTHGLILMTNDGDLGHRLLHPRHGVEKEYVAITGATPTVDQCRRLEAGVDLEDGQARALAVAAEALGGNRGRVRLTITMGRKRVVRRMLAAVGLPVEDLCRTRFAGLDLGRLHEGGARRLRPDEVAALRTLAGLEG